MCVYTYASVEHIWSCLWLWHCRVGSSSGQIFAFCTQQCALPQNPQHYVLYVIIGIYKAQETAAFAQIWKKTRVNCAAVDLELNDWRRGA